ncbi:hypothetical protein HY212_07230 [Candidatus Pacearchaeota archaeon]|nr:hypothetical protein [Candidatus Pacearchaeota archaeon]
MARNKQAAMEMSVGTLVTIVLLMVVLVLGIVLVRTIFKSGTNAVNEIDSQVQDQINKLFADEATRFVIYPPSREISIAQGDTGGVGFSMRNTIAGKTSETFGYSVYADPADKTIQQRCGITITNANNLITLGGNGVYTILNGNKMDVAALIKFSISKTTPLCLIRYKIDVKSGVNKDGTGGIFYGQPPDFDLKIVS